MHASPRSTGARGRHRSSSRGTASTRIGRSGSSSRPRSLIPNAVDPAIFHPPAAREPLAGRRVRIISTSWSDNPNKGADVSGLARREPRLGALRADVRRTALAGVRAHPQRASRSVRAASPTSCAATTCSSLASLNDPARTRCSRRSPAGCRPCTAEAAAIPSSSAREVLRSTRPRRCPRCSTRSSSSSTSVARAIRIPALSEIADRYLEVLRA